jgi:hypothetical protein
MNKKGAIIMVNPRAKDYIEFGELVDKFNVTDERIVEEVLYLSRQFSKNENVKLKGKGRYTFVVVAGAIFNYFDKIASTGMTVETIKDFYDDDTKEIDWFFIQYITDFYYTFDKIDIFVRCPYCGNLSDSNDPNVLCKECRTDFGHTFIHEL